MFYQKDVVDDHGRDREDNDNEKVGGMMKPLGYANDKRARFISSKGVSTTTSWPHHDTLVSFFFLSNKDWLYSTPCRQERGRCLTSSHPTTLFSLYPLVPYLPTECLGWSLKRAAGRNFLFTFTCRPLHTAFPILNFSLHVSSASYTVQVVVMSPPCSGMQGNVSYTAILYRKSKHVVMWDSSLPRKHRISTHVCIQQMNEWKWL